MSRSLSNSTCLFSNCKSTLYHPFYHPFCHLDSLLNNFIILIFLNSLNFDKNVIFTLKLPCQQQTYIWKHLNLSFSPQNVILYKCNTQPGKYGVADLLPVDKKCFHIFTVVLMNHLRALKYFLSIFLNSVTRFK